MATNAPKTIVVYDLNGQTDYVIPFEYLARKFVVVTLIGQDRKTLELNNDYRFIGTTKISLANPNPEGYDSIELRRFTSATDRLVDFHDGSILRAYDLNLSQIQTLHVAEEARDLAGDSIGINDEGDLDARGRRIVNLGDAINDKDVVNYSMLKKFDNSTLNNANKAKESELKAKTSETNAKTSETNAKKSEVASKNSEVASKKSEVAAKASEVAAKKSEDVVVPLVPVTEKASKDAIQAAKDAKKSEGAAKNSEVASKKSEVASKASEDVIVPLVSVAEKASKDATTANANAKKSEVAAKKSEVAAKKSEDVIVPLVPVTEKASKDAIQAAKDAAQAVIDVKDLGAVPVGSILMFGHGAIPAGFIDLGVAAPTFDVVEYPDLAKLYPSGNLPSYLNRYPKGSLIDVAGSYGAWMIPQHTHETDIAHGHTAKDNGSTVKSTFKGTALPAHKHEAAGGGTGNDATKQSYGQFKPSLNKNKMVGTFKDWKWPGDIYQPYTQSLSAGTPSGTVTSTPTIKVTVNSLGKTMKVSSGIREGISKGSILDVDHTKTTFAIKAAGKVAEEGLQVVDGLSKRITELEAEINLINETETFSTTLLGANLMLIRKGGLVYLQISNSTDASLIGNTGSVAYPNEPIPAKFLPKNSLINRAAIVCSYSASGAGYLQLRLFLGSDGSFRYHYSGTKPSSGAIEGTLMYFNS